jgi:lysozyme family protein
VEIQLGVDLSARRSKQEYWSEWQRASVKPSRLVYATSAANFILNHQSRYQAVGDQFGCPFWVIGCIHYRESSFDFNTHLANGDPLFDRHGHPIKTVDVPAGLGPFNTWEEGAVGALKHEGWHIGRYHWDVVNALENLELFNGAGYIYHRVVSPYLFSFTNIYVRGKFGSDGHYNPNLVDQQGGCVAVMKVLQSKGVQFSEIAA